MKPINEMAKELHTLYSKTYAGFFNKDLVPINATEKTWIAVARHIQSEILKARIDEIEIEKGRFKEGIPLWELEERINHLQSEIEKLKEG